MALLSAANCSATLLFLCMLLSPIAAGQTILNQIADLSPGKGLLLGRATVRGDLNEIALQFNLHKTGPRARDFSLKMVWISELEQALFLGANHGSPHRLNDVWAFDLAALEWVLLYGPDNPRSYKGLGDDVSDVRFRDGVLQTERGGPAVIAHTWWGITYDPTHRKLLFMNTWVTDLDRAVQRVGGNPEQRYAGPPLWQFDPFKRTWSPVLGQRPWPRAPFGAMLEYVDTLGGAVWHANNWRMRATWLLNPQGEWSILQSGRDDDTFQSGAPATEQIAYVDPQRDLIVAQREHSTFHFDVATKRWERKAVSSNLGEELPSGHDARSVMYHDPKSGLGVLFEFRQNRVWLYDPDALSWTAQPIAGDPPPKGRKRLAYFDPARDVFVVVSDLAVWVFRLSQLDG